MTTSKILVADDDRTLRRGILFHLTAAHYEVSEAASAEEAIELTSHRDFDLVITDLKIPDVPHGMEIVRKVKQLQPTAAVMVMTSCNTVQLAVQAMRAGADDFVAKDATVAEIKLKVDKVLQHRELRLKHVRLIEENDLLKRQLQKANDFRSLVAESATFQETLKHIVAVAEDGHCPLLLHGESGTGKERVARAIHHNSPRKNSAFVPFKIAPGLDDLMEANLFGQGENGGTDEHRAGKLQTASGGTLFLYDVADMSSSLQARLLKLMKKQALPAGKGNGRQRSDVRIIAATARDLSAKVAEGHFSKPLWKQLTAASINLPPLRERREDIPVLAKSLMEQACKKHSKVVRLRADVLEYLKRYDWPGNVRELKNNMEQLVLQSTNSVLTVAALPRHIRSRSDLRNITIQNGLAHLTDAKNELLRTFEKTFISDALSDHQWNVSRTARAIGVSREGLHRMIKRYGLCRSTPAK